MMLHAKFQNQEMMGASILIVVILYKLSLSFNEYLFDLPKGKVGEAV